MQHSSTVRHLALAVGALVATAGVSGCTLKEQNAPPLAGPSELSTSVTLTATPDMLPQDGASQSMITIVARDAANQPIANLALRLDMAVGNMLANDFGRLSTRNPVTGGDGRATVVYTAPPWPPGGYSPDTTLQIYAVPVGTNFDNANWHGVSLRLVEPTIVYAPGSPYAQFTYSPGAPRVGQNVFFDASASYDGDGSIVAYQWVYGDGDTEGGQTQLHDFPYAGVYYVTLTVTDNEGKKSSTTHPISVSP
jgi:PKD repeat protein